MQRQGRDGKRKGEKEGGGIREEFEVQRVRSNENKKIKISLLHN